MLKVALGSITYPNLNLNTDPEADHSVPVHREEDFYDGESADMHARMWNGTRVKHSKFPFFVLVGVYILDTVIYCSGSLVSDEMVLTAAHCMMRWNGSLSDLRVWWRVDEVASVNKHDFGVKAVYKHPHWDAKGLPDKLNTHDIIDDITWRV